MSKAEQKIILQTREASRSLVRELDVVKAKVGLLGMTYSQGHILLHLENSGMLLVAELAEKLRLDKSTTSRAVNSMIEKGHVKFRQSDTDKRCKPVILTEKGRRLAAQIHDVANVEVSAALETLTPDERVTVIQGMQLYARALYQARTQRRFEIREVKKRDNVYLARIIHDVMSEFQLSGPGTSLSDDEVGAIYESYRGPRALFYVVEDGEQLVGGAGIAQLEGGDPETCELKKMYLLPEVRGTGVGRVLLDRCLDAARDAGYHTCYLETIREMSRARALYEQYGFEKLDKPLGNTGHFRTDSWYAMALT
jgi:putative acetyltransferase